MLFYLRKKNSPNLKEFLENLSSKRVAGIIVANGSVGPEFARGLLALKKKNIPVIMVDFEVEGFHSLKGVFFDYRRGGWLSARTLFENGHKHVALATPEYREEAMKKSYIGGFCDYYKEQNHPLAKERDLFVAPAGDDFAAGVQIGEKILNAEKKYTAIAAINDSLAAGVLSTMIRRGVRVPEEISIIGMDDNVFSCMTTPQLSTVRIPAADMGNLAAKCLLDEIGGNPMSCSVYVQASLVERESLKNILESGGF